VKSLSATLVLILVSLQVHFVQAGAESIATEPPSARARLFSDPVGFCSQARGVLAEVLETAGEPEIETLVVGKKQLFLDDRGLSTVQNLKI